MDEAVIMLRVPEVAQLCGVSDQTVREWVRAGHFPGAIQGLGKTSPIKIPKGEVLAFIAERLQARDKQVDESDVDELASNGDIPLGVAPTSESSS